MGTINTVKELSKTNLRAEKLQIMLAAEEKCASRLPAVCWSLAGIPLSIRLEEAKNQFQRLPDRLSLAEEVNEVKEQLTGLNLGKPVKDSLLEIRQIIASENNELSRQLLSEVDKIEKKFLPKVEDSGDLSGIDRINFKIFTRRLLYL